MPNLGAALRAELAKAVDLRSLRKELRSELRVLVREIEKVKQLLNRQGPAGASGASAPPAVPADRIRAVRAALGESRKEFAKRLGVSSSIVFLWESGRSVPRRAGIVSRLQRLIATTPERPEGAIVRTKRPLKLSRERRAALKLQGQYMGHLRNLKPKDKAQVKELKVAKGYNAAIALARKLAAA